MSIVKKLLKLDQRIIFLMMFIALAYPILSPIILPMAIQDYSKQAFDFADSIPSGSVVLLEGGNTAATYPQTGPGMESQIYHMLTKGVKIVFFSIGAEAQLWTQKGIDNVLGTLPPGVSGKNGEDWVNPVSYTHLTLPTNREV